MSELAPPAPRAEDAHSAANSWNDSEVDVERQARSAALAEKRKTRASIRLSVYSTAVREHWGSQGQFLMSCMAAAVGLGNVWRFPAMCAKLGGASFFIVYVIVMMVVARPLFLLELTLGQFASKGSVRCWDLSPIFTGVGYAGAIAATLLSTFYIMIMAWAVLYAGKSCIGMFTGELAWGNASAHYFEREILHQLTFDSVENGKWTTWKPQLNLVLALLVAWILIWATMVGGVEVSGKIAYITALAPYFVLVILVCVGLCLDGAMLGVIFFLVPDFNLLFDHTTWYEAVGQCFFSLGIGFGGLVSFSSYNQFNHNIFHDVMIISIVDFVTSVLAGLSLMTILGFQATQTYKRLDPEGKDRLIKDCLGENYNADDNVFEDDFDATEITLKLQLCQLKQIVKDGGAGIAFIQYPAAMHEINQTWGEHFGGFLALLFFLLLILLSIGASNGLVGTTVTIIQDQRPNWKQGYIVTGVCFCSFLFGLIYTNSLGSSWIELIDNHGVTAVVYLLGFFEAFAVFYVYGLKNFCADLKFMRRGLKVHWYFELTWAVLPFILISVYMTWLIKYVANETWTPLIKILAWVLTVSCLLVIPAVAIQKIFRFNRKPLRELRPSDMLALWKRACRPCPRWGPKFPVDRIAWKEFKANGEPSFNLCDKLWHFITCKPSPTTVRPSDVSSVKSAPRATSSQIISQEPPLESPDAPQRPSGDVPVSPPPPNSPSPPNPEIQKPTMPNTKRK